MKYSLILIAGLALAGCNLETPPPTETTQQTSTVGLQFASMPVGLEAYSVNGDGEAFFMRYVGKQGRYYVVKNYWKGNLSNTEEYHADGTLYRRTYPNGNVRTFSPRRCMRVLGECSFTASNTHPKRDNHPSTATLTKSGSTYTYRYEATDGSWVRTFKYRLGEYNLIAWGQSDGYSERLVKVVTP